MEFLIRNREITCTDEKLIADNGDYIAKFTFDDEWNNQVKTARFIHDNNYYDIVLADDQCVIPIQILKFGYLKIGVFDDIKTTTYCNVFVRESIKGNEGSPLPPIDDVYAQIISLLEENLKVKKEKIYEIVDMYFIEHPIDAISYQEMIDYINQLVVDLNLTQYITKEDIRDMADEISTNTDLKIVDSEERQNKKFEEINYEIDNIKKEISNVGIFLDGIISLVGVAE